MRTPSPSYRRGLASGAGADAVPPPTTLGYQLACPYCSHPIAATAFHPWEQENALTSAVCPDCGRPITMALRTFNRQLEHQPVGGPSG